MRTFVPLRVVGVYILMLAVIGVVFGASVTHEFVTWDDPILITENPIVTKPSIANVQKAFSSYDPELYIPLTFLSYQLNTLICGIDSGCFHAVDLLLHSLNATLVFVLLSALLGSDSIGLILALLFAVHPLNTEAVVWASARKDTLSTLFFLSAFLAYVRSRTGDRPSHFPLLSLGLFFLGLLSKVTVVTLPVVLLFTDLLEGRTDYRRMLTEKFPYFVLAIVFGIVAVIGKQSVLETTSLVEKMLMAGRSTVFYLSAFLFPIDLAVMVPYTGAISFTLPTFFVPALVLFSLAVMIILLRTKYPYLMFGSLFFITTLSPSFTNFAKGGDLYIASDRYAYIPMFGLLFILGACVHRWMETSETEGVFAYRKKFLTVLSFSIVAGLALLSHAQTKTWANSTALYEHTIRVYPEARAGITNLGMERLKNSKYSEAIALFDASLALRSDPKVRANRASALVLSGDIETAKREYEAILASDPTLAEAHYNLGNIARREGRNATAIRYYQSALAIDPVYFNALNNLSAMYVENADWAMAGETYGKLSDSYPDMAEPAFNAGVAYEHQRKFASAQAYYERAVSNDPRDATGFASLATVLYEQGQIDLSARTLMNAIVLDPSNAVAIILADRMKKDGYAK